MNTGPQNDWFEKDFYKTLGVSKDASEQDIKKAYRKLARKHHPDTNPDDKASEQKFKEIGQAYQVLSDPEARKQYDQVRAMGSGARFTAGSGGPSGGGGFEDVFSDLFNRGGYTTRRTGGYTTRGSGGAGTVPPDLSDLLGGFGGFGQPPGPSKGRDVTARTRLSFTEAINGSTVKLTGQDGFQVTMRTPPGVKDGQKIRLRGKGRPSPDGGASGDLVVTVDVEAHPVFTRDGDNLRITLPVTFDEAALGAQVRVPTLGGQPVTLKIPAGTPSGRVLRLRGKGVKTKDRTGDLLVTVEVVVPQNLSGKAKTAVEDFAKATQGEDPRRDLYSRARAS